ncbi:MAG: hypothetical protein MN733_25065 [Nitrososphaera sp.]|nr:hypothetical protein [Nitrososphaera sp.]
MGTIVIDPADFISGPFRVCPKCEQDTFGILMISDRRFHRRCKLKNCWNTETFELPQIRKQVLYLDQFAISNMMKFRTPAAKGHERVKADPFWSELCGKVEHLCQVQLLSCPDSAEHRNESLISPFYRSLKDTYEQFSGGVTFRPAEYIRRKQVHEVLTAWLNKQEPRHDFDAEKVTSGRIHAWQGRIQITVSTNWDEFIDELRQARDRTHKELAAVYADWQKNKPTFDQAFELETSSYQCQLLKMFVEVFVSDNAKREEMVAGLRPFDLEVFLPSQPSMLMATILGTIERHKSAGDVHATAIEFLKSGLINSIPANIISGSLWASFAVKAGAGEKVGPNRGAAADVEIVSTLLPYCDAVFIDNHCRSLYEDIPKNRKLPFPTRIFSLSNKDDLLRYLNAIESSASQEHRQLVAELYGVQMQGLPMK